MSLKVKELKEILNKLSDNAIVHNEQNEDFIHIVACDGLLLSTRKPIGTCKRTGEHVYPSIVNKYSAFSPELDEDLFDFEWIPNK